MGLGDFILKLKRVYIEITNICNLNCSFCSPLKREKGNMSATQFEHILKEIKPYNPHIYLHLKGEPLIHPDFSKILELAKSYGLNVNLTTNGTLINNHFDDIIKNARQVNISVHSLSDGQVKDYNSYLENIIRLGKEAEKNGSPYVSYRMWNGNKNEEISDDALLILKAVGKEFGAEIEKSIHKGRDAKKLADNVFISFMEEFIWPSLSLPYIGNKGKCLGSKEMLGILCDGTVVPCCLDGDGVINLGNIFENSLNDILNSERFININKGFSGGEIPEELCQKCSYRTRFDKI